MSSWHVWMSAWAFLALNFLVGFAVGITAVLLNSDRLGGVAGICLATAAFGGLINTAVGDITEVNRKRKRHGPGPSRADRARLRDEQRRIDVEAEIRRMEREAGL